jgi:hypothetical protein
VSRYVIRLMRQFSTSSSPVCSPDRFGQWSSKGWGCFLLLLTFCLSFLQLVVQCYKRSSQGFEKGFETFNSLIILVAWEIWKQRNSCVFEEARPNVQVVQQTVADECGLWCSVGALALSELLTRLFIPVSLTWVGDYVVIVFVKK